jgi:hypothetical protein
MSLGNAVSIAALLVIFGSHSLAVSKIPITAIRSKSVERSLFVVIQS